jgi:hypothetical protein
MFGAGIVVGVHHAFGGSADGHAGRGADDRAERSGGSADGGARDATNAGGRARVGVTGLRGVHVVAIDRVFVAHTRGHSASCAPLRVQAATGTPCAAITDMAKAGQHDNDGLDSAKPRGHEKSQGRNKPDQSEPIATGSYKKPETYRQQAAEHSGNTGDRGQGRSNINPWNEDIRDYPDTTSNSPRARDSDLGHGRSGSDSNQSR